MNQTTPEGWGTVDQSIMVDRSADELYRIWRDLSALPSLLTHVKEVREITPTRSHWTVTGPLETDVEWDSEITEDLPGRRLSWHSVPDAQVDNVGKVEFLESDQGTEIRVRLAYRPPAGSLGKAVATLFGKNPDVQVAEDLKRFKERVEAGTFATRKKSY